ncbi:MAG: hypothetical protein N2447_05325 [Thermoanaerobaculum sp.]|nr:hypothetical protein [Thermoanaerobaculum sp.]
MLFRVDRAPGTPCPRCWRILPPAGDAQHPQLCPRCLAVVQRWGEAW